MTENQIRCKTKPAPCSKDHNFTPEELASTPFDAAEFLDSEKSISAYLAALLEEGNPKAFLAGLSDVARARGMSQPARTDPEDELAT